MNLASSLTAHLGPPHICCLEPSSESSAWDRPEQWDRCPHAQAVSHHREARAWDKTIFPLGLQAAPFQDSQESCCPAAAWRPAVLPQLVHCASQLGALCLTTPSHTPPLSSGSSPGFWNKGQASSQTPPSSSCYRNPLSILKALPAAI